jgi:hypothetical protein
MPDPTPIKYDVMQARKFIVDRLMSFDTIKDYVGTHPLNSMVQIFGNHAIQGHTFPCILVQYVSSSVKNAYARKIANAIRFDILLLSQGDTTAPNEPTLGYIELAFQHAQLDDNNMVAGTRITGNIDHAKIIEGGSNENVQGFMVEVFIYSQQENEAPSVEVWNP